MEKERADRDEEIHLKLLELEVKRKKEFEERKKLNESKKINKAFDDAFNLDLHHYKTSQSLPQRFYFFFLLYLILFYFYFN